MQKAIRLVLSTTRAFVRRAIALTEQADYMNENKKRRLKNG